MIRADFFWVTLFSIFLLSSCTIGNGRICGPQTSSAYCDKEAYEALVQPKPFISWWKKDGATPDARLLDGNNCGGGDGNPKMPFFNQEKVKSKQTTSGLPERKAYAQLFYEWERCMLNNGYQFTGECVDNEISNALPRCGAP